MAKQGKLPGMTSEVEKELEDLAEQLDDLQQQRLKVQGEEGEVRTKLREFMRLHKIKRHDLDDEREVIRETSEEKAYVRKKKRSKKKTPVTDEAAE